MQNNLLLTQSIWNISKYVKFSFGYNEPQVKK
jgi:hypothetical protein